MKNIIPVFRSLFLLAGFLFSLSARSQNVKYEVTFDSLNKVRQYISQPDNEPAVGYSILIAYKDSIILVSQYGLETIEGNSAVTDATHFYIASIAKTFTANAILKLKQEKKIDLSDKISKYLPGLPAYTKDIRIYHLLAHLSGIKDIYDEYGEDLPFSGNGGVIDFVKKQDSLLFDPGVSASYSNTGYVLLSMIVEKISGLSFTDYIQNNFLDPAGMSNTMYAKAGTVINNRTTGYVADSLGRFTVSDVKSTNITGPGGYYSTVYDLHKWITTLKKGKLITQRNLDIEWNFPITFSGVKSYFGMGWTNETWGPKTPALSNLRCYGSIGVLKGFRSMLMYLPDLNLDVILLSNSGEFPLRAEKVVGLLTRKIQ